MAKGSYIGQVQIGQTTYPVGSLLYGEATYNATNNYWEVDNDNLTQATFTNNNLAKGITIHVKFNASSSSSTVAKLKVGGADEKPIVQFGTTNVGTSAATSWRKDAVVSLTFDGTSWVENTGIDSNNTYTASDVTPSNVAATAAIGTNTKYARADHVHAISVTQGTNNGEIVIGGTTIKPKNIAAAAFKGVDTSITTSSTSTNVPTSAAVANLISTATAGLTGAMHFIGSTSTTLTDGATTSTLEAASTNSLSKTTGFTAGDVVLSGDAEFVWLGSAWELLGNESSYKIKQTAISSPAADGNTTSFIDTISQNEQGVISVTKKTVSSASTSTPGIVQLNDNTNSNSTSQAATANAVKKTYDAAILKTIGTTKGDIIYWSNKSTPARLGIGTANQILKATTDGPSWSTPSISVTSNTSGSVVTGVTLTTGTSPSFTQGTLATATVDKGTLTLTNQTKDTFNQGAYPTLGTISKASLGVSLS